LGKLKGVTDPELKRKVIGNTFIEVFDHEATKLKDVKWLAQGTIYPDVIESAGADTGKAQKLELANGKDAIALKSADKVVPTLNAWIEAVQGSEFDALLNKEVASLRRVK
ncbi:MAG: hypothetical protein NXI15_14755, partial [Gammaproteobacteria bacterium]|nr:hypothetical protein [Gammaproteobacteria bacterium]